jgi:hypothetical protein
MANLRRRILKQTESLFAGNHEHFFNSIGQTRRFDRVLITSDVHPTTDMSLHRMK